MRRVTDGQVTLEKRRAGSSVTGVSVFIEVALVRERFRMADSLCLRGGGRICEEVFGCD